MEKKREEDTEEEYGLDKEESEDGDVYSEKGLEDLEDDDEIDVVEEGLMEGYHEGGKLTKCAYCGRILSDAMDEVFEELVGDKVYRFCSADHAELYITHKGRKLFRQELESLKNKKELNREVNEAGVKKKFKTKVVGKKFKK